MKSNKIISKLALPSTLLTLAAAGSCHAAGVWSTIDWIDDSSLSFITSTNVTHSADFGSAATVNGFTFETITINDITPGDDFGTFASPYTGSNFTITSSAPLNTFTFEGSAGVSGSASSALSAGLIAFDGDVLAGGTITYLLTGLTANTNYEFYFFSPEWTNLNRPGSIIGSDAGATSFAIDQSVGTGDKILKYAYNTGASTSFSITVTSDVVNNGIHNYAFVNTVPETSTALLSGLGILGLLRRRRN